VHSGTTHRSLLTGGLPIAGGPTGGGEFRHALDREIGEPGKKSGEIVPHRKFQAPTLSTTERMAATLGPDCGLPMWIRFFRPKAIGRIESSARLLLSSNSR
jgi:hypothetical protein